MSYIVLPRDEKTYTSDRERFESAPRDKQLTVFSLIRSSHWGGEGRRRSKKNLLKKLRELESRYRKDKQA